MEAFKTKWNKTCLASNIPALSLDTSARIMSIIYVHGGDKEVITHNTKLRADLSYIQDRFNIEGGRTCNAEFAQALKAYVKELETYAKTHDTIPEWAKSLMKQMYNIKM